MENAKIKNFIILILALMNIFLLFIVISDAVQGAQSRAVRNEALYNILAARSIAVSDDVEFIDSVPTRITLKRNLKNEERMLTSVIGRTSVTDMGGNIYYYDGAGGNALFRSTGVFKLSLDSNSISLGSDPVKSALSILSKMGIDCRADDAEVIEEGASVAVTLNCSYKGEAVFNTYVTCRFTDDSLAVITGRRLLDDVESKSTPDNYPDIATIIMDFLQYIESRGEVCTEITALDLGYFAESEGVGSYSLVPVWRISTNVRTYYFDASTGEPKHLDG